MFLECHRCQAGIELLEPIGDFRRQYGTCGHCATLLVEAIKRDAIQHLREHGTKIVRKP